MNYKELVESHPDILRDRHALSFSQQRRPADIADAFARSGVVMLKGALAPETLETCAKAFRCFVDAPEAHESFSAPEPKAMGTLFDHCVRALDSSLAIGSHGLPLFGAGDWNDGMNRVGAAGRGESVWLGWFLHAALLKFAPIAERRGQSSAAAVWRKHAFTLQQAIEREAWDGDWYRRGYFDDGTPLGSVASDECRIDSIAQSWAVISGAAERERAVRAMSAVDSQLVSRSDGLVKLFTPAFDRTRHDPGYIKAYPPGIRENGGQYTHAAM